MLPSLTHYCRVEIHWPDGRVTDSYQYTSNFVVYNDKGLSLDVLGEPLIFPTAKLVSIGYGQMNFEDNLTRIIVWF